MAATANLLTANSLPDEPIEHHGGRYGSTPRTARLRARLHWKAPVVKEWANVAMGLAKCFC